MVIYLSFRVILYTFYCLHYIISLIYIFIHRLLKCLLKGKTDMRIGWFYKLSFSRIKSLPPRVGEGGPRSGGWGEIRVGFQTLIRLLHIQLRWSASDTFPHTWGKAQLDKFSFTTLSLPFGREGGPRSGGWDVNISLIFAIYNATNLRNLKTLVFISAS